MDTAIDSVLRPNDVAKGLNQLSIWLGRVMPNSSSLVLGTFEVDCMLLNPPSACSCCRYIVRWDDTLNAGTHPAAMHSLPHACLSFRTKSPRHLKEAGHTSASAYRLPSSPIRETLCFRVGDAPCLLVMSDIMLPKVMVRSGSCILEVQRASYERALSRPPCW